MLESLVAMVVVVALVAYALLAGADFGGGVWDLFATGRRKDAQRTAIADAMAPVWEANHVWLIFVIVMLFTAFPRAFAALNVALFVPFHLVLFGIILRGAAFMFRAYGPVRTRDARSAGGTPPVLKERGGYLGVMFGAASVVTPFLLGAAMGAVSSGSLRVLWSEVTADFTTVGPEATTAWLRPISLVTGALALALCAYLAAVYLTNETDGALREDFRRRALVAGTFVVALSGIAFVLAYFRAGHLFRGLVSLRAAPIVAAGVLAALASGAFLLLRRWRLARVAAAAQVALLLVGWGLAQYPYVIYPDVTVRTLAAARTTLRFVLVALPVGAIVLLPSLWLLFRVFKTDRRPAPDVSPRRA